MNEQSSDLGARPPSSQRSTPLWKRLAVGSRDGFYRIGSLLERLARRRDAPPLPPLHLRIYYYGTAKEATYKAACDGGRLELISRGLRPEHRVLDIGCGIGNLALGLTDYLSGGYDGLDIHGEAIDWCQRAITPRYPSFRFHHVNIASNAYNAHGHLAASTFRFPFPDNAFDFVFLGSVFTHLLPEAVEQYVSEIGRVLAPGGVCVASYFLVNAETRVGVEANTTFMPFSVRHPSGLCFLHDALKPEAAVALEETFVTQAHERAGLRIRDIRRGAWWRGGRHDQDVLTAERPLAGA
jgi:SAM-dependent methyltransferase